MEFPGLGNHCAVKSCNRLDYLPMKCDACSCLFCMDHFSYAKHSCSSTLQKDVQVPVCPLCNSPVPSRRGEQPDIAVGEHIDRDCQADPAVAKRKIYTNRCNLKGCKQKELIPLKCESCHKNFCLKHRHPSDHQCQEQSTGTPAQRAAAAATARAQNSKKNKSIIPNWFQQQTNCCASRVNAPRIPSSMPPVSVTSLQGKMSEDEAYALAIHKSLNEKKPRSVQEEEDRQLALAIANCDQHTAGPSRRTDSKEKNCSVS